MLSLIYVESKGNTHAVGDGGKARGVTQIWVSTAQDYGDVTAEQLPRPGTNISFAFKHFHHLLKKFQGNLALTLYAWNRGSRKVDQLLRYGEPPGNSYAKKVYQAALVSNRDLLTNGLREYGLPGEKATRMPPSRVAIVGLDTDPDRRPGTHEKGSLSFLVCQGIR